MPDTVGRKGVCNDLAKSISLGGHLETGGSRSTEGHPLRLHQLSPRKKGEGRKTGTTDRFGLNKCRFYRGRADDAEWGLIGEGREDQFA